MKAAEVKVRERPIDFSDWRRALPWVLLMEVIYLVPYCFRQGGVAGKYIWDEHCVAHTYPAAWLARQEVLGGFFPLWNPFSGCGLPLLGNTLDETILPYALVKYLFPFPLGLNVYLALKLFIALTGAFGLGLSLSGSRRGGLIAAALYGFTGFITLNINSVIGTTFVLPWCLFGLHRLALRPSFNSFLITTLAFGMILLGGNPQTPYQAALMGYGLYLAALLSRRTAFSLSRYFLLPGFAAAPGLALALPQLLPFVEYLSRAFSHHFPGYGQLHLDPRGIIGVMSPLWNPALVNMDRAFFTSPYQVLAEAFSKGTNFSNTTIPVPFEHLGLAAVFFLLLALRNLKKLPAEAAYFAAVVIACLGLAFGLFPFSLIARVPPFDQVSNWRFTTFPSGLACSALAAMLLPRMQMPEIRKTIVPCLAALAFIAAVGMALVASQAGLALKSLLILGPTLGVLVLLALLAAAVWIKRPEPLIAFCFLELFLYDRVTDRSLLPHPFNALKDPKAVTQCVPADPQYRFLASGDILHPSLGMFLGRYDFRSYEMIFPDDFVQWLAAVNNWDDLEAVKYYMTHYYFAPETRALASPELAKASLRSALSEDFLDPSPLDFSLFDKSRTISPGPEYIHPARETIFGADLSGWFQHAPSLITLSEINFSGDYMQDGLDSLAWEASVAMSPSCWKDLQGDGVTMQILGAVFPKDYFFRNGLSSPSSTPALVYSRYLDPRRRPNEQRWIPLRLAIGEWEYPLKAEVLPGPRDNRRSDYALWMDFHDAGGREENEFFWKPLTRGPVKCYQSQVALPRLRVAGAVKKIETFCSCLDLAGPGNEAWPASELIVDESGGEWPAGRGEVKKVEWGANRIGAEAAMEAEGTVVLADTFYPGWEARIDGRETRIYRANCVFRAVRVPAGRHEVEFRFAPRSFRIGLWAGVVGWLVLIAVMMKSKSRD